MMSPLPDSTTYRLRNISPPSYNDPPASFRAGMGGWRTLDSPDAKRRSIDTPPYDFKSVNVAKQREQNDSLLQTIRKMIAAKKEKRALGFGALEWIESKSQAIAAYSRTHQDERLIILNNTSSELQSAAIKENCAALTDLLSGKKFTPLNGIFEIELKPYEYLWLKQDTPRN
jgi:maltose alpha-D-glucosyltransferase/alpha-amylase